MNTDLLFDLNILAKFDETCNLFYTLAAEILKMSESYRKLNDIPDDIFSNKMCPTIPNLATFVSADV